MGGTSAHTRIGRLVLSQHDAPSRRIALAGVAGILITASVSLQPILGVYPVASWLLTACGVGLVAACLSPSWSPPLMVARASVLVCLVFCCVTAALVVSTTTAALRMSDHQLLCSDDVAPDTVVGGQEVVRAVDPYTEFNLLTAEGQLGCPSFSVTPERSGTFASLTQAPSTVVINRAARATEDGHPTGGLLLGFNYPAGTALLGVLGVRLLVLASPLALLIAGWIVVIRSGTSTRALLALAIGAQSGGILLIGSAHVDGIVAALLMVGLSKRSGWMMGAAVGLACAIKQTAWFIAPALLVLSLREGRARDLRYSAGACLAFVVINLPFILAGPSAWLDGVLSPQTHPLFALGFGPGTLIAGGRVTAFEIAAVGLVPAGVVICASLVPDGLRWG